MYFYDRTRAQLAQESSAGAFTRGFFVEHVDLKSQRKMDAIGVQLTLLNENLGGESADFFEDFRILLRLP